VRGLAQREKHGGYADLRKYGVGSCGQINGVEKVRALSGGEGSLIDTGGVSM
jgi:hypothetical protein